MNILFLTLARIDVISERGIYTDLLRKFRDEGHSVFIVTPSERRYKEPMSRKLVDGVTILNIKTLNIQKTNIIEKGLGTLMIEGQFLKGVKKYLNDITFDLVLYSTPPITFTKVIHFIKERDGARSYLLLKDIFPQNAVDLGMIKKGGILHKYFRKREKQLYEISDRIGCMSEANIQFVLKHNKEVNPGVLEFNPNSIDLTVLKPSNTGASIIKKNYNVPDDSVVFVYGGNLGKPQGIDFLIEVLNSNLNTLNVFFLIVGSGTEFNKLNNWFKRTNPKNALLLSSVPKQDYDDLLAACDVGLLFLDHRFNIPNFPSRILSYMEKHLPVIAATDRNTDIGDVIVNNKFGYWCESIAVEDFNLAISKLLNADKRKEMGEAGYKYLIENYNVEFSYRQIIKQQ